MSPLLVLDTNIVRQAHEPTLRALRAKGYRLAITAGVVSEWLARAGRGANNQGPNPRLFFAPAKRLAPHLNGACPVTPAIQLVRASVLADAAESQRILFEAVSQLRLSWESLLHASDDALLEAASHADAWLESLADFSTRMNKVRAEARGANWRDYFAQCFEVFDTDSLITERFHAMVSYQAVCCAMTVTETIRVRRENDTQDLLLLGQIALGAFVATDDRNSLLTPIRDSGTYQAPWIRTVDEYLAAERLPACMPWGDEARREAELFFAELSERKAKR